MWRANKNPIPEIKIQMNPLKKLKAAFAIIEIRQKRWNNIQIKACSRTVVICFSIKVIIQKKTRLVLVHSKFHKLVNIRMNVLSTNHLNVYTILQKNKIVIYKNNERT